MRVVLPNQFEPRPYQRRAMSFFDRGGKRAIVVWHRRSGKDLTFLHQTCKSAHKRRGVYWHVYPTAEEGRKAIWEGFTKDGQRIMEQVFPKEIRKSPREFLPKAEMIVELKCGSIWRLLGSDRIEVVGAGPVGVVFSEYALAKPSGWNFISPMLDENGGWAAFISTPRGNNHAKKLFDYALSDPSWFADLRTLYDTRVLDPDVTLAAARARGMPEPLVRQEWLCDWTAALVGSVWGDLLEVLEKSGAVSSAVEGGPDVFTSWDLGVSDSTAIWTWCVEGGEFRLLDYYEAHGKPLSHYFDHLDKRADQAGWRYVKHWLPHDAKARTLATGLSIYDQAVERLGVSKVGVIPRMGLLDGIQAGRWVLQQPIRFNPRCADGLEALKAYRYEYDEDKKTFGSKPLHNWSSHGADAFRYFAIVAKVGEHLSRKPVAQPAKPLAVPMSHSFTLEQLWEAHGGRSGGGRI